MRPVWWIAVVNLGGITGPIRCAKWNAVLKTYWDRTGDWDAVGREGLTVKSDGCIQFESEERARVEAFALGARALGGLLAQRYGK